MAASYLNTATFLTSLLRVVSLVVACDVRTISFRTSCAHTDTADTLHMKSNKISFFISFFFL